MEAKDSSPEVPRRELAVLLPAAPRILIISWPLQLPLVTLTIM